MCKWYHRIFVIPFFFKLIATLFIYLFIYLSIYLAVLGLRFCARAFSSCRERGPLFKSGGHSSSPCAGLSLSRPLLLRSTGSRRAGSVVVAHGPSRSAACGILPYQGSNPCPLPLAGRLSTTAPPGKPNLPYSWVRSSDSALAHRRTQMLHATFRFCS